MCVPPKILLLAAAYNATMLKLVQEAIFVRMYPVLVKRARLLFALVIRAALGVGDVILVSRAIGQSWHTAVLYIAMADILFYAGAHREKTCNNYSQ
jgi:hypothetical protein